MSVYKRTVRGKKSRNYYVDYEDEQGRVRTISARTSDKRLAEQIKRRHVDRVRAIRSGLVDPSEERFRDESARPLSLHVRDYLDACRGRGEAPKWVEEKERSLRWFEDACGGQKLSDIRADQVDARLAALTGAGKSARTVNLALEVASALLNWCVRNGRLRSNPLRVIRRRNQVLDPRHPRRALTHVETTALLGVARRQAAEVPGAELRPLWYLFPLLAGLRREEMVRLRWADLALGSSPPSITIRGGKAKKRLDVLPLHPDLVRELEARRPPSAHPTAKVFPSAVMHSTRRKDFQRAGIVLENEHGHADLHSLRHTYGTRLAERGVAPAKLQRLMRHATVELAMRYYVHLDLAALDEGLGSLLSIETPRAAAAS